ncbi:G-protein-signaling modulator 2 [Cydia pomonella]|uniref:G-protein-signaling modulator 2 n=1 Tax=Cydia pomonella TaxID=82600 RepID=UPI002ADE1FB4|nr:G-protein-signaling modulator 2 [Cydia pomonella]XP_061707853.1 G-protein-signaling modulator 2 [Cydia pomonella]
MSVSASAENLSTDAQSCDGGSMCLELALEGERLCKAGDCRAGVAFFQAAIQAGTDDLRTLSAIYSQLGNAYFYLGDYNKAMQYHKHDLTLARTMNDKLGEAKASGNLGNTLKVMGKFSEAIQCCKRHLEISRSLGDRLSEGRALYNLGNVYHAQGKQLGRAGQNDPGHFPQEVRDCLMQAVSYYEENLELMRSLGDRQAMGRACGNLGNTCYLLGDFARAIRYHTERLQIAQEFGDQPAERRANSNLGNSHIFLGEFENAAEHYKRTLALAEELGDAAVEAQACYSLGNTYTLLREYRVAEEYHARHLASARKLQDRVGEGRACWSLGNAHAALGNHEKALYYANEHYNISKELGDVLGMATAQMNISDLRKVLGLPTEAEPAPPVIPDDSCAPRTPFNALRVRRQSMEQLSLIPITPDGKKNEEEEMDKKPEVVRTESEDNPVESFFELLTRCQSERMDEQRATLNGNKENRPKTKSSSNKLQRSASSGNPNNGPTDAMLDMITDKQSERMDSQRAELRPAPKKLSIENKGASLPGLRPQQTTSTKPEDDFLDMLARVQGSRLEDQRSELPPPKPEERPKTVPDDDFFALLMRAQAGRMEDQRATIPLQSSTDNRRNKGGSSVKK